MLLTRDYLQAKPWDALIARVNETYGTELEPYSTKLESIESLGGTRTKVVIIPNQSESDLNTAPPVTRTEYLIDRLDLATFFKTQGVKQLGGFTLPTNTFEILDALAELNQIVFTLNDFVHVQYDKYGETFTLKANPKSLRFVGEIQFQLVNTTKKLLSSLGTVREFPNGAPWPLGSNGTKGSAQYCTAGYDFTEHRDKLINVTKDSVWPTGRALAVILEQVTQRAWVCATDVSDFNICHNVRNGEARVEVFYNGIVLPRYTSRKDIANVLILQLSDLSNNISGFVQMHYN